MIENMTRSALSVFVAMTLSVMALPQLSDPELAQESGWNIHIVDSTGNVGRYTSIALDSSDYPRISYYDDTNEDLKYAKWTGSGWGIERVDSTGNVGRFTSLALDNNDLPHISYYDDTNEDLKYAKWTGGGWGIETVDSTGDVGMDTSIALDNSDYPHISYLDRTSVDLRYARWNGSTWNIEAVDSAGSVGGFTSIAIDSNDNPHIGYFDMRNGDLKYAWWNGSAWSIETIDSAGAVGWYTSMALDTTDNPHISYFDVSKKNLKYVRWSGSKWIIETLDSGDAGYWTSIALDGSGYPHISYHGDDTGKLKYATWTGSEWSIEIADSRYVGRWTSIALDSSGYPHISYDDSNNRDLKYATKAKLGPDNEPPVADAGPDQTVYVGDVVQFDGSGSYDPDTGWETMTVHYAPLFFGPWTSIALDSTDYPHISYNDISNGDLRYAKWTGSAWLEETIDSVGDVGRYTSLAIDSDDNPHVGYYEQISGINGNLKYAKWNGTAWNIETVDIIGSVGRWTSIALDNSGNPHMSYYDESNQNLKYAKWTGSAWINETVDSVGDVGLTTSIALDSGDNPHISYYEEISPFDGNLKYAYWTGSTWSNETVDSAGHVGVRSSIALDNNDHPHMSYFDFTNNCLKYAKWNGTGWNVEIVYSSTPNGHIGWSSSIAVDSNDYPHIGIGIYPPSINYAKWTGGMWSIERVDAGNRAGVSLALDSTDNPHISYLSGANMELKYARKVGGIVSYDWDFGDGSPHGTGVRPTHVYDKSGIYNVTLTVTDAQGATDTDNCIITVLQKNRPPIADANGPYYVDEGSPITLDASGSYDPDGDTLQYRWDLNNDGIWDSGWSSSPYLDYTWGDDYSGEVTVEVSDGRFTDTDTATITVNNIAPLVELKIVPIHVNVSLRIAGEKWHDVSIELYEDNILIAQGNLTRYPGSPNDQTLDFAYLRVNISRKYSAIIRYTPENDPINGQPNGANPCWVILKFSNQDEVRIHHTFNVQHPKTYTWEVDLAATILLHGITFEATAYDPGADDLTLYWDFGDGTSITDFYPNVNKTFPVQITETVTHVFPGSGTYTVTLTVEDDDGGVGVATLHIVIP